ncbi:hypothetical protein DM860_002569 [Cuscuta australis]|uniref:Carboxypeptidase n=1 Tax=Cuscuta australis TaxID=267555 RepID=A0A328D2F0_9ASTE|nr:hypothetical protein DM860_002569 [Cuscuta australis]
MANNQPNTPALLFICFLCLWLSCTDSSSSSSSSTQKAQDLDRIRHLPGQPNRPLVTQYSGYITVNESHGRALFYWFFQAQSQPSIKPLILWLNGGPGCSSIGYGAASELGPLRVQENGSALHFNNYSWNKEANLLFVESPVGVGFSYTNTSSDLTTLDDHFVAQDSYNFIANWLETFPQFKNHDFFLAGESYAGHYVPQLAEVIFDRNKDKKKYPHINLKGFIVGNPETNDYYDYKGLLEYAWSHAVISDQNYDKARETCDFASSKWSNECNEAISTVFSRYEEIDIYNIYAPKCLLNDSSSQMGINNNANGRMIKRIPAGGYAPCYSSYAEDYFNKIDVQMAFHVNIREPVGSTVHWKTCSDPVYNAYDSTAFSVLPIYQKLIKGELKIWIYSGDADGRVPVIGTRYWIEALKLPLKTQWRSWFHNHQVGGRIVEYNGLTFVTVRGAGHLVPLDKPSEALALVHSFLSGEELPRQR